MNIEQLYPILAALLISVASYLISYINNKKLKEKVTQFLADNNTVNLK